MQNDAPTHAPDLMIKDNSNNSNQERKLGLGTNEKRKDLRPLSIFFLIAALKELPLRTNDYGNV